MNPLNPYEQLEYENFPEEEEDEIDPYDEKVERELCEIDK
jgi:hypothetical protein